MGTGEGGGGVSSYCWSLKFVFHLTDVFSGRYYEMMRRQNYVTPTSYLELIKMFKTLLNNKRMDILNKKFRYQTGLEKINFSEAQVSSSFLGFLTS